MLHKLRQNNINYGKSSKQLIRPYLYLYNKNINISWLIKISFKYCMTFITLNKL